MDSRPREGAFCGCGDTKFCRVMFASGFHHYIQPLSGLTCREVVEHVWRYARKPVSDGSPTVYQTILHGIGKESPHLRYPQKRKQEEIEAASDEWKKRTERYTKSRKESFSFAMTYIEQNSVYIYSPYEEGGSVAIRL